MFSENVETKNVETKNEEVKRMKYPRIQRFFDKNESNSHKKCESFNCFET